MNKGAYEGYIWLISQLTDLNLNEDIEKDIFHENSNGLNLNKDIEKDIFHEHSN